ncbi:hypothetical protein [Jiangella mangrovi]|uniref:Uncharacterized protein n=1 Tax=Jiangella mangrovi TaxID=1524084 RepID=A0A7W9GNY3_9ACTN|nr:hypothetical protein [Jiangella mangrovi]MBB5787164.1 hypothetical protein [Jiangella mangrovi]
MPVRRGPGSRSQPVPRLRRCAGLQRTDVHGWSDAEGETSDAGVVSGTYTVTGTWDGSALTLTETPEPAAEPGPGPSPDFTSPCEPPAGGWAVVDPATATNEDAESAHAYAESQPDWVGAWSEPFDRSAEDPSSPEYGMVIFAKVVLNYRFTGDLERHEAALREIWGGALCVSEAPNTMDDLRAIQDELTGTIATENFVGAGVDTTANVLDSRSSSTTACRRAWTSSTARGSSG